MMYKENKVSFFFKLDNSEQYFFTYLDLTKFSNNDMSINTMITILIVTDGFQKLEQKQNPFSIISIQYFKKILWLTLCPDAVQIFGQIRDLRSIYLNSHDIPKEAQEFQSI